ncbi:helix-turn-helix transcriptional regulator [Streptomyces prasinus]|uniref:helix-turn-helix transcriptional regulator n=1 Tax=Streptomyces prasinus TaxID=67345 RepID=UPI0006EBA88F|nr:helix-turn-helix transcriptional regulator [Streptomyces prasinus]
MTRGLTNFSPAELRAHRLNVYALPRRVSMTAEELAKAVGATKAQILAYENGHRVPDPPRVRTLARALKVHPWQLMNLDERDMWTLADYRRASGLRAQDVVEHLNVSPKNYRRFENEGIVPSRRPQFVDQVASVLGVTHRRVEQAIDRTPAVQRRQTRAFELVLAMAERYVPMPGPWRGPALDDPNLLELAAAYGRPAPRIRRVLTYELGELRQSHVRAQRERVIADYDTDLARQASARYALNRWHEIYDKELVRIPRRLERFHRTAQPSDVWQLLVDLHNVDAAMRQDAATWAVTKLLCKDPTVLPRYLVERNSVHDVEVCRLSSPGASHVNSYAGLYAALYPGVRRPIRTPVRANSKLRSGGGQEAFTLPNRTERLVVPQPALEAMRTLIVGPKHTLPVSLSPTYELAVGLNSISAAAAGVPFSIDDTD